MVNLAPQINALLICDKSYKSDDIEKLASSSAQAIALQTSTWIDEDSDYPLESVDVVLLDLSAVMTQSIDPDLLGDIIFSHVPTVLLGDSAAGEYALNSVRAGAMDWLIHDHLDVRPLYNVLELAMMGYSRHRDLIISHARYKDVVEDQSEYICRFLPDFTITFANQSYTEYVNKSSAMIEGLSLLDITPMQERDGFQQKILSLTPEFPIASYDRKIVIEGDVYWQHWSDKAFFDSNGVMLEIQSIGVDITERRSAEQEALDSSARFHSLFKYAPVMMCELDSDGLIENINEKCVEVLGYKPDEVIGKYGFRYLEKSSRSPLASAIPNLSSDGWIKDIHCTLVTSDLRHIQVKFSATAQFDIDKNVTGVLIIMVENNH